MEQKKTDDLEVLNVDKNIWAKTMENIILHLKLLRGVRGVLLAYAVRQNIKIAHISSGHVSYLNLDKDMIAKSNPNQTMECLDKAYASLQCDTFKINNALVYHILSKIFKTQMLMYT